MQNGHGLRTSYFGTRMSLDCRNGPIKIKRTGRQFIPASSP
jgi:hypothetical protein